MNKQHYVYKITNLNPTDSRIYYIGVRTTTDALTDTNYMGSSKYLKKAISKQGIENFKKEILSYWENRQLALSEEIRLHEKFNVGVNEKFYNMAKQTSTRFDTCGVKFGNKKPMSEITKEKLRQANLGKKMSEENKKKRREFKHTTEAKKKISEHHRNISGEKNPSIKQWLLTSPENNIIIVTDGLKKYCEKMNLHYQPLKSRISRIVQTTDPKFSVMNGWKLDEIKIKKNGTYTIISKPAILLDLAKRFNVFNSNNELKYEKMKLQELNKLHRGLRNSTKKIPLGKQSLQQLQKLKQFNKMKFFGWYVEEIN